MASSWGPRPGPVSLTLTKSHIGVSSATGTSSGKPMESGNAHVSSSGGVNETSYCTVMFRTSRINQPCLDRRERMREDVPLEAVKRMAFEIKLVTTWPSRT